MGIAREPLVYRFIPVPLDCQAMPINRMIDHHEKLVRSSLENQYAELVEVTVMLRAKVVDGAETVYDMTEQGMFLLRFGFKS